MSKLCIILSLLLPAAAVLMITGCEVDSLDQTITITPSSATVKEGQSVQFVAAGGYEYKWELSSDEGGTVYGTLSARTGPSVVYKSIKEGSNFVETLKVTSTIPGSGEGSTNTTATTERSATAYITHDD